MEVTLKAITFNHTPNSATNDAFSIRRNEDLLVSTPEWIAGPTQAEDSLAAYARDAVGQNDITIQVELERDPVVPRVWVRALDGHQGSQRNVLGTVRVTEIPANARQPLVVSMTLENVTLANAGVSVSEVIWKWQFSLNPNDPNGWSDLIITNHRIYTVLDLPTFPWEPLSTQSTNTQIPWTEVLEVACAWAEGAQNEVEAATAITEQMFALGGQGRIGYTESATYAKDKFDCTAFLDLLNTGVGNAQLIDCDDCATVVSTFTNILGGQLWQSDMGDIFHTKRVKKIGASDFARTGFPRHAVAWKLPCDANSPLYDACLELNKAVTLTGTPEPLLATNVVFGSGSQRDLDYKFCLVLHQAGDHCDPKRDRKTRRPLGKSYVGSRRFVDEDFLALLRKRYRFESWPAPEGFDETVRDMSIDGLLESSPIFHEWDKKPPTEFVGFVPDEGLAAASSVLLFRSTKNSRAMIEINLYQSNPPGTVNDFLLQLLAQFERTDFERQLETQLGDVSFTVPEKTATIFRRGKFSSVVRTVGRNDVSILEVARAVDDYLKKRYQPPVE
jgi:hypothetical protein